METVVEFILSWEFIAIESFHYVNFVRAIMEFGLCQKQMPYKTAWFFGVFCLICQVLVPLQCLEMIKIKTYVP